jgi:hypothetical protein
MTDLREKLLSLEAKKILIQIVLANIPTYMLSFFKFLEWALNLINTNIANYLWSDVDGNKRST